MSFHAAAFSASRLAAVVQGRQQLLVDGQGHGHVDRRGKDVVGALAHVHVIVGMDGLRGGEAIAAAQLDGPIGDHLVDVHVGRGARAGLKDIHRKLVVEASVGHLAAGGNQGLDLRGRERVFARTGQFAQIAVGDGGRPFYQAEGMDQFRRHGAAGDGEVFHGPLGLGAVIGRGGQADFAHRVVFDAVFGSWHFPDFLAFSHAFMIATYRDPGKARWG